MGVFGKCDKESGKRKWRGRNNMKGVGRTSVNLEVLMRGARRGAILLKAVHNGCGVLS